jgi:hypothetical protein
MTMTVTEAMGRACDGGDDGQSQKKRAAPAKEQSELGCHREHLLS